VTGEEMDDTRLFTVDEANELIPKMEMIMGTLQRAGLEIRAALESRAVTSGRALAEVEIDEVLAERPELRGRMREIEESIGEIEELGAQFKGLDLGLVDFPSEIDGEVALLCWQFGEKEITHWHPIEAGFAGRQLLPSAKGGSLLQ
jgi:hypothetical protein